MTLTAAVVAFVNTIVVLISQFGASVSETQQAAISAAVNAGMVLGALIWDFKSKRTLTPPPAGSATPGGGV